ncbi:MAG: DUF559 domain-containing protein [Pseudonocardia sp.]
MAPCPAISVLQARQDGLVTFAQAADHGLSARAVQRRVRSGEWRCVAPRVYLGASHPLTERARVRAASLWAGDPGVLSGPAAAWWHGMLTRPPRQVEVTIPRTRGLRPRPGVVVRRRDLDRDDLAKVRGVAVTGVALTALETAAALPDGSTFLDRALQHHVGFRPVYAAYCRNLGAHGSGRIAELLIAAADRADSAAERVLTTLLRRAGIDGWTVAYPFGRWTIDLAFPAARLAVEVDGWAWHADVARFQADRTKGNALVRAGWVLLRFTWHDLVDRPEDVIRQVVAALATVGPS